MVFSLLLRLGKICKNSYLTNHNNKKPENRDVFLYRARLDEIFRDINFKSQKIMTHKEPKRKKLIFDWLFLKTNIVFFYLFVQRGVF